MKSLKLVASGVMSVALLGITASAHGAAYYPSETAYYGLNGNTNDSSGNGYNGTVNGTTSYGTGFNQPQAFSFNGSTYINTNATTNNLGIYNGSFTVDAWVNFANNAALSSGSVSVFGTTGGGQDMGLHLLARNDAPFFGFYNDDLQGTTPLAANTWYNIAWVFNSATGTQSIYVDGKLDSSRVTTGGPGGTPSNFLGNNQTVYIGQNCCGSEMTGLIEDVGVYNAALTQAQIEGIISPEPSSIVALLGLCGMGLVVLIRCRRRSAAKHTA